MVFTHRSLNEEAPVLLNGQVGLIPTDATKTFAGVVQNQTGNSNFMRDFLLIVAAALSGTGISCLVQWWRNRRLNTAAPALWHRECEEGDPLPPGAVWIPGQPRSNRDGHVDTVYPLD